MSSIFTIDHDQSAPSLQERITCLYEHGQRRLFDEIDEHPQAGVHDRNGELFALILSYLEGEVNKCGRAANVFIRKNAQPGEEAKDEKILEEKFGEIMRELEDMLDRKVKAVKNSRDMALSSPPSRSYMDHFRFCSGFGKGVLRAANGEKASWYGQENDPVPYYLATLDHENLEPVAKTLKNWLMDPFDLYIAKPIRKRLSMLPIVGRWFSIVDEDEKKYVEARYVSAVARALVGMMAILSLVTAITVLDSIKATKLRITVMALFGGALVASAQYIGPRSIPVYILVTAYFQVMVFFVSTTSGQNKC